MRIGISTSVVQRGKTGIAQYLFELLRAFLPCAGEHEIFLFVLEEDVPLFEFAAERMRIVPVGEQHRPAVRNIVWHQRQLPAEAARLSVDVLHVPSYRRLLWTSPCPRVATIHDLAPFHVSGKYDWKRMLYGRVIVRQLAQRQHRIIAVSQNTADDIFRFFRVPAARVQVIHNGLNHDRFTPAPAGSEPGGRVGAHEFQKPFALYVARLEHPGKNHVRLIKAYEQFRRTSRFDWQLVFGGSDWHGAEAIHHSARVSPYAADIRFLGFVPDSDLPALYRAASVFVYPSLFEGFGMPPVEAMACGCPVVCSDRGSLREVVGSAAAIVEPEDPEHIASQLIRVAEDATYRDRLRRAGLKRAAEFNWEHTAKQTLEVYEHTVSPTARHSPAWAH